MKTMIYFLTTFLVLSCTEPMSQLVDEQDFMSDTISNDTIIPILADTIDTLIIFPSEGWQKESTFINYSTNFDSIWIDSIPDPYLVGIKKKLDIDLHTYDSIFIIIKIDTISTFLSTGVYSNASPWIISVMDSTYAMNSYPINNDTTIFKPIKNRKYQDVWNWIIISSYNINNSYPKFLKINSIKIICYKHVDN